MTAHQDPDWLDEVLAKLVDDITIAGYGKKDSPNPLIGKRDKQPFAGYKFCQDKAKASIESHMSQVVEEVIGEKEYYREHYPFVVTEDQHIEMKEKIARDNLRAEQRQRLAQLLDRKKGE